MDTFNVSFPFSIILTSLIFTIPLEIMENTTRLTNVTTSITNGSFVNPAHEVLSESRTCFLAEKSSFGCNLNTNNDTETANKLCYLTKMITELFNSSRTYFKNNKTEIVEKIITITNHSLN